MSDIISPAQGITFDTDSRALNIDGEHFEARWRMAPFEETILIGWSNDSKKMGMLDLLVLIANRREQEAREHLDAAAKATDLSTELARIDDIGARQFALNAAIQLGVITPEWELASNKTRGDIVVENATKFHAFLTGESK